MQQLKTENIELQASLNELTYAFESDPNQQY
jgi:hypothetical protein